MAVPVVSLHGLSDRERAVFRLVGEGLSAKQIGNVLKISPKTVEFHKRHLFDRLGVSSSLQLVRLAATDAALRMTGRKGEE